MTIDAAKFEPHRVELRAYAYRMLGSAAEAEDAVQETFVKAWKAADSFEGRASLRTWLYRIATNVCLDMIKSAQRRVRPMDMRVSGRPDENPLETANPEAPWLGPVPDEWVTSGDPSRSFDKRETIKLAFVSAVQHLPARQRAALIMRDVLSFSARETADALDISPNSVNSALQRARATLSDLRSQPSYAQPESNRVNTKLAESYANAFETFNIDALKTLLHDDVVMSMPPLELWLTGPDNVGAFITGPGKGCEGSKLIPVHANGSIAFGHYKPDEEDPSILTPWSITVLETDDHVITGLNYFLDVETLWPMFGLAPQLPAD
ncbi:sigma-70 family RNA polymerase sigma factor [Haloglycomyces albus]|uniref:sigma-70 family RNA polymerase sigma factor n=1 Tax=Haloglycomyces albus TaxID=526067 RepID=UPI0004B044BC|nr:sigma-70 family RNA polymerase sigma factor [Haloglycomyces albus]